MKNEVENLPPLLMTANVFTLSSLIFAQPVLDILGRSPEFFVANHLRNIDVYLMLFALTAVIPTCLMLPALVSNVFGKRVRSYVQTGLIFLLTAVLFSRALKTGPALPGAAYVTASAVLAGGFSVLYLFNRRLPSTLGWLTPVVALFPILFLANANVQEFLRKPTGIETLGDKHGARTLESHPPIVMVVWDELPLVDLLDAEGNIDAERFPNFNALASESTWYENASTVWITTFGALPAILTGTHPTAVLPRFDRYPNNLFSMVAEHYDLNVFESITELRPPSDDEIPQTEPANQHFRRLQTLAEDIGLIVLHLHLPQDYTKRLPSIEGQWGGFVSREGSEREGSPNRDTSKHLSEMSQEEREAFLASMTDAERTAFKKALAEAMTDEDRKAFSASMSNAHRRALSEANREQSAATQERISKHFNESRKDFFEGFIRSVKDYPSTTLHFAHVALPHPPSIYLPSGQVHTPPDEYQYPATNSGGKAPTWSGSQDELNHEHHRLRLQIGFSDRLLGLLLSELKRLKIYEDSLIVVCADHGGSFLAGEPRRWPTPSTLGDVAFVPLFIKYPNQKTPLRNSDNVELIDILPTISDVLGAELDWKFDGRSLVDSETQPRFTKRLPPNRGESEKVEYTETEYLNARQEAHKRVVESFSLSDPRSDIFHYGKGLEFIGKDISTIDTKSAAGSVVSPDTGRLSNTDPASENMYPSIRGTAKYNGPETADLHVAVAVNSKIAVIAPVFKSGSELNFAAIVPDEVFTQKTNTVELALLDLRETQ